MSTSKCIKCGIEFEHKKGQVAKYCTRGCYLSTFPNSKFNTSRKSCPICGKILNRQNGRVCSSSCDTIYRWIDKYVRKELKIESSRNFYIYLFGYKCERCGLSDWKNKPITLQLHHIDGDRKNNDLNNLEILCPNCHSQTDNFGNKNRNV